MVRIIMLALLAIVVAGTGYWGYQEHQEKNAILIHAENNYQRAFHDLAYQVDLLHDKIGTTLAMNSKSQLSPALTEVWRITSEAHSNVGQLPLTLLPFNKTEEFLAKIGEFSYRTAVRDLENNPLSETEYDALKKLYSSAGEIQRELRNVQHMVIKNNLRWMDVELALASQEQQMDNTIIDGFKTVEKNVEGYAEVDFGPEFSAIDSKKDEKFQYLKGESITKEKAIQVAKQFLGLKGELQVKASENGEGSDYGFYSISILEPKSEAEINMDITKKGGHPIWIIQNREVEKKKISLNKAAEKAKVFLNKHKFENVELFESAQYDSVGVFTFVAKQDDVRVYPDSIRVKIALDDGAVVGFSARDYLMAHHTREIPQPTLTIDDAMKKVNPNVKVMEDRLAIIENELGNEVLCFEILGTINEDTYRIYINAENGYEEKVEKLKNAEPIFQDMT
jgi:spore germination protein